MSHTTRRFASALVIAILAGNAAQAAPWSRPSVSVSEESLFSAAWHWLAVYLLPAAPSRGAGMTKEGGMMDPNGAKHLLAPSNGLSEAGGMMDPDGTPHASSPSGSPGEAGGMMDPNG